MDERPKANLTVQMSRASDNTFRMRITDEDSSVTIASIVFDAAAFANLMSTRQAHVPAEMCGSEAYARIGKTLSADTEKVPDEYTQGIYERNAKEAAIADYAELRRVEVGADTVSIGHHNYGTALHFRTWR